MIFGRKECQAQFVDQTPTTRRSPKSTMHNLDDVTRLPDDFDGHVRLFPLPNLVVFPHSMQPLHIFEPRYCEMLAESLDGDRLIAMATLVDGASGSADQPAPIAPNVCIGKIISHAEVEDDRHNILLVGTKRARVIRELDAGRSFRIAQVEVDSDVYPPTGAEARLALKGKLLKAFGAIIPPSANVQQNLHELMAGQMGLGPITDIISYTLPFDVDDKLGLLGQPDVDRRASQLIELLKSGTIELHSVTVEEQNVNETPSPKGKFPPPFSVN